MFDVAYQQNTMLAHRNLFHMVKLRTFAYSSNRCLNKQTFQFKNLQKRNTPILVVKRRIYLQLLLQTLLKIK